jgi:hypothetical protein
MIDSSSKIKKGTKGDASVLRPTCLTAVPVSNMWFCKVRNAILKNKKLNKSDLCQKKKLAENMRVKDTAYGPSKKRR